MLSHRSTWTTQLGLILATGLLGLATIGLAQEEGPAKEIKRTVTAKDGLNVAITYWASPLKEQGGVVVLLHGHGGSQLEWGGQLPKDLQEKGFAVITVDLRGHGLSKGNPNTTVDSAEVKKGAKTKPGKGAAVDTINLKPADYKAMVLGDMEAVKSFIFSEHQARKLNMNKMAIIAAGMGSSVALEWAAFDWGKKPHTDGPIGNQTPRGQDVRALILLSPETGIPGLPVTDAVRVLKAPLFGVSFLVAVGKKDKLDKGTANKLYDQLATPSENKERMFLEEYDTANRGAALLAVAKAPGQVFGFLDRFVMKANSEWRDRESRLGKKKAS